MEFIQTPDAPDPGGHYSQAVVLGDLVFTAGMLPIRPGTGEKVLGSVEEQTEQVLKNIAMVVEAAGSSVDRIVKTTVYVSDIALWGRINQVYADFFGDHRPARAVVPTRNLHFGFLVEIDAIAALQ